MAEKNISAADSDRAVIGKVGKVQGDNYIVLANGEKQIVREGQPLHLGDQVVTQGSSAIVLQLDGADALSLGHDQTLTLDQQLLDLIRGITLDDGLDESVNFELIAQAIEEGQNLEELLPPTAAGGGQPTTANSSSSSAEGVRIERTAAEVTPESGFETQSVPQINTAATEFNDPDPFNQRPTTTGIDNLSIDQGQTLELGLTQFFSDPDENQTLTYELTADSVLPDGVVFDSATGLLSGVPTNAAALTGDGSYQITVVATDSSSAINNSVETTFTIQVNNVNDQPVVTAGTDLGEIQEDHSIIISEQQLLANASDIDGDVLTISDLTILQGDGVVTDNGDGTFTFTPAADWHGDVQFSYVINDGNGGTVSSQADLTVAAVNDAPVAVNDGITSTNVNAPITLNLLSNDYDVDGDSISFYSVTANRGTLVVNPDNTITYTPPSDYVGRDFISYTITDGNGETATSIALVNITDGNLPPELGADTVVDVNENAVDVGNYAATDPNGDNLTYSLVGADAALFQIDASGYLQFIQAPDYEAGQAGPYNVTVVATDDGFGNLQSTQNVTVNVVDLIDETPVLGANTTVDIVENETAVGNFSATDADNNDTLTYSLSGADAELFQVDSAGNLSFISAPDYDAGQTGPYQVIVMATDLAGLTDSQTVTVNVTNVLENTAPVLGSDTSIVVAENTTSIGNFSATDGEGDTITYSIGGADASLFQIDANGNLSFISAPNFEAGETGPYNITITATDDGEGNLSTTQNVTVNVSDVNEAPSLGADATVSVAEGETLVGSYAGTDPENDTLNYSLSGTDAALFTIDNTGQLSFITAPNYEAGETGPYQVIITATDPDGLTSNTQTITVNVSDVNEAPSLGADTTVSVVEGETLVGSYAGTDPENDTLTYTLSGTDAALFSIDNTGQLSFVTAPNYEAGETGPYQVIITATDPDGLTSNTQTITVNVSDVNEAPSLGADATVSVNEGETLVGSFVGSDPENDTLAYSLSGTDAALFSIDNNGQLSFVTAPNYEAGETGPYQVIITATDPDGLTSNTQTITVNVSDVNEAPSLGADATVSVVEGETLVGNYAGTDPENDALTYSLSGTDAPLFSIDNNGQLSFVTAPNYEAGEAGPYQVVITATDPDGLTSNTQTITVNVSDVNEAPSLGANATVSVNEGETLVGRFVGTDPENDALTYTLSGTDAALFSIDNNGQLSFVTAPNYEAGETGPYQVIITATDPDGLTSNTQTITVNVSDVNEAPSLGADATVSVAEGETLVGSFVGSDPENDTLAYSLSGTDAALFSIDNNGQLSFVTAPNYEAGETGPYQVIITATDPDGLTSNTQTITVNVSDVNEAPSLGADATVSVAEGETLVGSYAGTDPENDTLNYSLSGTDAALFTIDNTGQLSFITAPNYEAGETGPYQVIITATDPDGLTSNTQTITVNVSDVNEAPSLGADATVSVAEGETLVGNYTGSDPENDTLSYSLSGTDAGLFAIDTNGQLSFVTAPNYEAAETGPYQVTITATDPDGLTSNTQTITVNVSDVNEAPSLGADATVSVNEGETLIGNYAGTDPENDTLSYSLSGTDAGLFTIDTNGQLSFVTAPNYEAGETGPYQVIITATDPDGLTSNTQTITVNVSDVNEAPSLGADATVSVVEGETLVGSFVGSDPENDALTYSLSGTDAGLFAIDTNGQLSFVTAPNYEAGETGPYQVIITATDPDGLTSNTQTITINVSDVNEAPQMDTAVTVSVAENTVAVGTFTGTDPDGDPLTYSISGTDVALFTIDSSSGALSFITAPNYEAGETGPYEVVITATDPGGLTSNTQTVTINVTDVSEAPVITAIDSSVAPSNLVFETTFDGNAFPTSGGNGQSNANGILPGNLVFEVETDVRIQFISESAGFDNVLGWYSVNDNGEITGADIIWQNANTVVANGQQNIVIEGVPAGQMGFFLIQDGYDPTLAQAELNAFMAGNGVLRFEDAEGNLANASDSNVALVYYSEGTEQNPAGTRTVLPNTSLSLAGALNPDGFEHVMSGIDGTDNSQLIVGFEDLYAAPLTNPGGYTVDWDLRDIVFSVSADTVTHSYSDIGANLSITDDGAELVSAEVNIAIGRADDYLYTSDATETLAAGYGITLSYDAESKALSLSGNATVAQYEEVMSAIQIANSGQMGSDHREIQYIATDTDGNTSDVALVTLNSNPSYNYSADDYIEGDDGANLLIGREGEDIMFGGAGQDTFQWNSGDDGSLISPITDTIRDFTLGSSGDTLDFADVLQGESLDASVLDAYFDISFDGADSTVSVDVDGDGSGSTLDVVLTGVDLTLLGTSDQQIIQQLIDDGNLHTN
ncbi:retention module-containing protein [Teredinibacter sp. KSP-S5-2]|uniref:retention module-containing protein n=1 Tax=Teredinibacter sp. KSP-S5-2 TaxID=3034506 RepID=UPI00293469A8|nr:retention module-containing protein [Teredinibacter sp. KSP-S5-2]WNO10367.1 retention module-containing protein [Teredinibacter sp. KSP-S5-2]